MKPSDQNGYRWSVSATSSYYPDWWHQRHGTDGRPPPPDKSAGKINPKYVEQSEVGFGHYGGSWYYQMLIAVVSDIRGKIKYRKCEWLFHIYFIAPLTRLDWSVPSFWIWRICSLFRLSLSDGWHSKKDPHRCSPCTCHINIILRLRGRLDLWNI